MFKLDLSSIFTMFFTFSIVLLLYFYFKKRLDLTENKVDIMFNLIQEHQKQIKMQQIVNGSCNLPFAPKNSEHLNKNENDESGEDSDSDDNQDSGSEDEDDNNNDEQYNDKDDNNNDDEDDNDNSEEDDEEEEEEEDVVEEEHHNNEEIKKTNLNDNSLNIDESVVIPESNLVEEIVDNIVDDVTDDVVNTLEVIDANQNLWTEDKKSDNLTILHDNNNNQIKISIVKNVESEVDYNKMKVSELKRIANERGIVGYSSLKKKELVNLLQ